MKKYLVLIGIAVALSGCIGGAANNINGDAKGGAGMDVEVYRSDNAAYFEAGPGGSRQLRQEYRSMVASFCSTFYGSCAMSVAIPKGSSCYCPSYFGPVWGQAN